ncbi:IS21 family transposase [Ramlibacter sp. H39-3-26]|uniref:IS21 family transposase n=1 Tax=Curvibacter soli TaxID=3031331 RepID=UPI0023D9DB10|nr:IS21 family transposase [Ramlibacter sp. H39-3-26]MDF1486249.1 IS21 family transposase [Ramlibacter sp. H39-3-26]
MPGKKITDHQVNKYKQHRNTLSQVAAAAKSAISERSARRIDQSDTLPSQQPARGWRTRQDPLALAWEAEIVPLLRTDVQLNAVTLLEELQRRHPGEYDRGVLRTLQRRMRQWRAVHGAERDIYFAQEHPPGRLALSDFTVCDALGVQIDGVPFAHRLYQFALAHSGWRHAVVVVGGESFIALSTGLQAALWALGGVPEEHRTDSLSAAFNNLAEEQELTRRYADLCRHYAMRASRCNPGQSHENGSIESRNDSLKTALDQALRLRGSRSFEHHAAYDAFVATIVQRLNARVTKRLAVERVMLRPLPARRTSEYEERPARVSKYAVFTVKGVQYSAPSQLIGHRVMVRLYAQHIECWFGGQCVHSRPRAAPAPGERHARDIDYRHLVAALKRKPGAFARAVLRDAVFPRAVYRQTWERLAARVPERDACRTMVGLLALAADGHEAQLANELEQLIEIDQLPDLLALTGLLAPPKGQVPEVVVMLPALAGYDTLIEGVL